VAAAVGLVAAAAGALMIPRALRPAGPELSGRLSPARELGPARRSRSSLTSALPPGRAARAPGSDDDSLIGHWTFDEPTLWTQDLSRGQRDCLLRSKGPTRAFTEEGRFGGAMDLSAQGWLICAQSTVSTAAPAAMTVAAWVKLHSFPAVHAALVTRQLNKDHHDYFFLGFAGNKLRLGSALWSETVLQPAPLALERWFHVAFTHDRDGQVRLFLDGEVVARRKMPHTERGDVTSNLTIGAGQFGRNQWQVRQKLDGVVDEVRVYDRALSPGEIAVLARAAN
jgi:hypothetical protein